VLTFEGRQEISLAYGHRSVVFLAVSLQQIDSW